MKRDCRKRSNAVLQTKDGDASKKRAMNKVLQIKLLTWDDIPDDIWMHHIIVPYLGPLGTDLISLVQTNRQFNRMLSSLPTSTRYPKLHYKESSLVTFTRHVQYCHKVYQSYQSLCEITQLICYSTSVVATQADALPPTEENFQNKLPNCSDTSSTKIISVTNSPDQNINMTETRNSNKINIIDQNQTYRAALDLAMNLLMKADLSHCSQKIQTNILSTCGKCGGMIYKLLKSNLDGDDDNDSCMSLNYTLLHHAQLVMQLVIAKRLRLQLQSHLLR